jgi:acetolactate synthase-1/2/3 large subunit
MPAMSGGELLARMLQAEGVTTVFGIIDGTYFGLYASLKRLGIQLVTPRHETNAAHMAGAYARLTGRLGVCMASNGPGVANILPGLVVEEAEGNRVLCLTSARRTGAMYPLRTGTYQGFDQTGVIGRIAKWSQEVPSLDRVPELMRAALRQSWEGRPGVVHLDVPENIINGKAEVSAATWEPSQYRRTAPLEPSDADVEQAADLLLASQLPMIHAGDHQLVGARRHGRALAARDPDDPRQAQSPGPERGRHGAGARVPSGRDRLVGQAALLA